MKILHISGAIGWGGNEQQLIDLIPELNFLGVENIVFGVRNSVLSKKCKDNNTLFIDAKKGKLNKFVNYKYLKSLTDRLKPDLIHLHTSDSLTVFTISDLLFGLKIKTVFSKKGIGASSSFLSKLKYNYWGVNSIFCVSKMVELSFSEILYEKNKSKTVVIHDCVSLDVLTPRETINLRSKFSIKDNCYIVGNIANHTSAKDLHTFINVANHLIHVLEKKEIVFFQIGEFSKLTPDLLAIVKEKNLQDFIFFTDKIENAFRLNPQFDLFLMTSEREGGPTSVLEAMLMGTPVVSTNVGVVPDVIKDGINGFVSPIKDYENLAKKIDLVLLDIELQKKFIKESKLIIEQDFVASKIARQTLREYNRILSSN